MKRQVQKTGVRKYFGADLVELQSEPLTALDAFFAEYGPCVVQGCEITDNADGTYEVAAGLVALTGTDTEGVQRVMVMPFGGASGVALPLYLTAQAQVVERVYGDGKVKPIAHAYTAQAIGVDPGAEVPHLTLTAAGGNRFVDAVQDTRHRFISDSERSKWNRILEQAKEYADGVSAIGSEAALRSAKEYTDTRETAILAAADAKDAVILRNSKDYTDTTITALIDSAPETMDTLGEVAAELKKHTDTATAMMQVIGEKATKDEVNAALAGKQNTTTDPGAGYDLNNLHTTGTYNIINAQNAPIAGWIYVDVIKFTAGAGWVSQFAYALGSQNIPNQMFHRNGINTSEWTPWVEIWHSGNFDPAMTVKTEDVAVSNGLDAIPFFGSRKVVGLNVANVEVSSMLNMEYANQIVQLKISDYLGQLSAHIRGSNSKTWRQLYHSGNLGPATAASAGLMSAADKAKLDSIDRDGMKLLGAGVVDGAGQLQKKNGLVTHAIRSGGTGYFRVFHTVGHTNYEVQATCVQYNNSNGYVSIRGKTASYFDVWTADDDSVNDVSFFFQIYEF